MREIKHIVLHCTATPQTATIDSIKRYWKESLGWRTEGYHYIIPPDGNAVNLVPIEQPSNGVIGYNANAIHVSYIGGVDSSGRAIDNRTEAQKATMKRLVEELSAQFPRAIIKGHRDFSPDRNKNGIIEPHEWVKVCPSFEVKDWLNEIGFKSKAEAKYLTVKATALNVREGTGKEFDVITTIPKDTRLKLIADSGYGWLYVSVVGTDIVGYVSKDYVR